MPTTFDPNYVNTCCAGYCENPPQYCVITLTGDGLVKGEQMGGTSLAVFCKECLVEVHGLEPLGQPGLHVQEGEEDVEGPAEIAMLIMPMKLTKSQVAKLREEICETIPLEKPV